MQENLKKMNPQEFVYWTALAQEKIERTHWRGHAASSKVLGEGDEQIENKPTEKKLAESCENLVLSLRRVPGYGNVKKNDTQEWLNQDEE